MLRFPKRQADIHVKSFWTARDPEKPLLLAGPGEETSGCGSWDVLVLGWQLDKRILKATLMALQLHLQRTGVQILLCTYLNLLLAAFQMAEISNTQLRPVLNASIFKRIT